MTWWHRGCVGIVIAICVAVLPLSAPIQAATSYKTLYVGHLMAGERYQNSYVYQDEITHHAFTFDAAAGDVLTLATQWITDPPPAGYGDPWQPVLSITPGIPPVGPGEGFMRDWDKDFYDGRLLPKDGNNIDKPTIVDWIVPATGTYTLYAKFYPYQDSSGGIYSIGFTRTASAPPSDGLTGESPQPTSGDQQLLTTPVVYVVLFHSPTCKYSQAVINENLPRLKEEYGDQLQVLYIDVSTTEGLALFQATGSALAPNHVAFNSVSTPTLITGDTIMVGGREISERLPDLISDGFVTGGIDLPPVPDLRETYETTFENQTPGNAVESVTENTATQPEASTDTHVPLTAQQEALLLDIGYPDAFDIIEMDGPDGAAHRYETWRYFRQNTAFVFLDGKFRYDAWEEYPPSGVIPVTVSPDLFPLGISKQAVMDRFDNREWETFTNNAFREIGLEFLVSEQIILGFEEARLVYVETIALPAEEGTQ